MKTEAELKQARASKFIGDRGMGLTEPICTECSHWSGHGPVCEAFDVIPESIWTNGNPHDAPVEGDRGIQFEVNTDV